MAIVKKPQRNQTDIGSITTEQAAATFIAGAAPAKPPMKRARKIPILVRFDPQLLARVDQAAERRGISRSAWIHFMISRALESEGSEHRSALQRP
jgi:predicted HicB family RNase H-like nuclease